MTSTTIQVPAENAMTGEQTTIGISVDNVVLDALQTCRTEDGAFDDDAFVKKVTGGFTRAEIDAQFAKVQNKDHWKNGINAVVPFSEVRLTRQAIIFHHGNDQFKTELVGDDSLRIITTGYAC